MSILSDLRGMFRGRVLLIEDEAVIALEVASILQKMGFEAVDIAGTAAQACAQAAEHAYDAAVVDIKLHAGNSLEAAAILHTQNTPFVFASGLEDGGGALDLSAPLLRKPYGENELRDALAAVMSRAKRGPLNSEAA